jgi:excisionase family DNA binding protein
MNQELTLTNLSNDDLRILISSTLKDDIPKILREHIPDVRPINDEIMNSVQAAKFIGVSRVTLAKWIAEESVPFKRMGSRLLFSKRQLLEWIHKEDRDISIKRRSI